MRILEFLAAYPLTYYGVIEDPQVSAGLDAMIQWASVLIVFGIIRWGVKKWVGG